MKFVRDLLCSFFLPAQCACCGAFLEGEAEGVCPDCFLKIHWIEPPYCTVCGLPFPSRNIEDHRCGDCLDKEIHFRVARAIGHFDGPLREMIHRWKYEGKTHVSRFLAKIMAEGFQRYWSSDSIDILIPVPLHIERLRERGFNQALVLARELSSRFGIPCAAKMLEKDKKTPPQALLGGRERERGVKGAFRVTHPESVKGKAILLVDDVYTTGATANECARMLMSAGAASVAVYTVARTIKRL